MVGVSALWDMAHMREKVGTKKSPGLVCRGVESIPSVGILKIYRRIAPMSTLHLDFLDHPPVTLAGPQPQPAPAPVRKPEPAAPLRLTDDQMDAVMRAAEPLVRVDRGPFLEAVAGELQGQEIGDGLVARVCARLQRLWLMPRTTAHGVGKWQRLGCGTDN